jgi:hypothetical protein
MILENLYIRKNGNLKSEISFLISEQFLTQTQVISVQIKVEIGKIV